MGLIMSIHDVFFRTGNYWYIWFFWLPYIISFITYNKWMDFLIEQSQKSPMPENLEDLNTDSEEDKNWDNPLRLGYTVFGLAFITVGCSVFVQIVEVPLDSLTFLAMFLVLSILNLGYLILLKFMVGR